MKVNNQQQEIIEFLDKQDYDEKPYEKLRTTLFLYAMVNYFWDENSKNFCPINKGEKREGLPFSPHTEYLYNSFDFLINYHLYFAKTPQTLQNLRLVGEERTAYQYAPYLCNYTLSSSLQLKSKDEILEHLLIKMENEIKPTKQDGVELWKNIAYYELLEYLHLQLEKNFPQMAKSSTHLKDNRTRESIKRITENFSVSEGMPIIFYAVANKEGRAYIDIADNINFGIDQKINGHWEAKSYTRNRNLPQSILAKVCFEKILEIGDLGFTCKPSEIHIKKQWDFKPVEIPTPLELELRTSTEDIFREAEEAYMKTLEKYKHEFIQSNEAFTDRIYSIELDIQSNRKKYINIMSAQETLWSII